MTQGHARLVLLLGHGASTTNNPQESAYHCGACGGHTGEVSARLLAQLLNDPETRAGLAEMGLAIADDTLFVAGLHDTTTDEVTLFAKDAPSQEHAADLAFAREKLAERDGSPGSSGQPGCRAPATTGWPCGRATGPKPGPNGALPAAPPSSLRRAASPPGRISAGGSSCIPTTGGRTRA